jgi:hypothetical protein
VCRSLAARRASPNLKSTSWELAEGLPIARRV